jgi:hypothetical protein
MKGYFSQLARATGLSFAPGAISPERGLSSAPVPAAPRERVPALETLHVEEVTFTNSSPAAGAIDRQDVEAIDQPNMIQSPASFRAESYAASEQAIASDLSASPSPGRPFNDVPAEIFSEAGAIGRLRGPTQRASPIAEGSALSIDEVQISSSEPAATRQHGNSTQSLLLGSDWDLVRGVDHHGSESPEMVETIEIGQQSLNPAAAGISQPHERESAISDATARDPAVEKITFQDYLREVSVWIAAKPEIDDADLNRQQGLEARNKDGDRDLSLEHETNPAAPRVLPHMREPELQDLSLSIGTISIVIEEPNQQVAIPSPPQPVAPIVTQERGREPTSLSRFYLRG